MATDILSMIAVAGAWVAGLAILFSIISFCVSTIKIQVLRYGLVWLVVTDAGLIVMLTALLILFSTSTNAYPRSKAEEGTLFTSDNTALIVFTALGLVALIALTVAAFVISRIAQTRVRATQVFDQTRRRLEF